MSVLYASTQNIVLTGILNGFVLDGYTLKVGDRILVKDQAVKVQNGIYIVGASKNDTKRDPVYHDTHASAQQFIVKYGDKNKNSGWICINSADEDIYGVDEIFFTQFFGFAVDGNIVGPNTSVQNSLVLWDGANNIKQSAISVFGQIVNGVQRIVFPGAALESTGSSNHKCTIPTLNSDVVLVTETSTQTITNKIISSTTNHVGANELRTNSGSSVRIDQSDPPQEGYLLKANSPTSATWQPFSIGDIGKIRILSDSKSAGSNGGAAPATNTWFIRDLNTNKGNMNDVTLVNNVFTLACGQYHIEASAPAYLVRSHQMRLFNVTANYVEMYGTSEYAPYSQTRSFLFAYVDLCEETSYKIEHIVQVMGGNTDLGVATGFGTENYTLIKIVKME